jgi:hypothetical protein
VDKKKFGKQPPEDLRGFEEFIEGESDRSFMGKGHPSKKEVSFEHFTFLTNDSERLSKLKNLLTAKLPLMAKFPQGKSLQESQKEETEALRMELYNINDRKHSNYRKSLSEIFDVYFNPPKP